MVDQNQVWNRGTQSSGCHMAPHGCHQSDPMFIAFQPPANSTRANNMSNKSVIYYIILYCIILYYIVLYYIILYYINTTEVFFMWVYCSKFRMVFVSFRLECPKLSGGPVGALLRVDARPRCQDGEPRAVDEEPGETRFPSKQKGRFRRKPCLEPF